MDPQPPDDDTAPPGVSGPTPPATKRLAGLLLVALGALLMGIGALMPWVRTSYAEIPDEVSPTYFGIDLADGKVVLGLAVVILVALIVSRVARSVSVARAAALVIIVAAFAGAGVAVFTLFSADARVRDSAVETLLKAAGDPTDEQRASIEEDTELKLAVGPFAAIGGGILAVVGGALTLAWANALAREPDLPS